VREGADASHDSGAVPKEAFAKLKRELETLGPGYDWRQSDPLRFLARLSAPVAMHHALLDTGADYDWSRRLAAEFYALGKPYEFYTYPSAITSSRARIGRRRRKGTRASSAA